MSGLGRKLEQRSRRRKSPAGELGESDVWGSELSPDCVGADIFGEGLEREMSLPSRGGVPAEIRLRRGRGSSVGSDLGDSGHDMNPLDVSDYTRRTLDSMGESQLEDARRAMEAAKDRQRLSGSLMRRQNELLLAAKHAEDVMRRMDALEGSLEEIDLSEGRPEAAGEDPPEAEREEAAGERAQRRGLGRLWGRIRSNLKTEKMFSAPEDALITSEHIASSSEDVSGAAYFRRGARKKRKLQYLQAVALFNLALVRQREELGENHLDCGATLNEIGVCWMMLGEKSQAMAALEEALYIRQKRLGDGAQEVAQTTNNIWMLMHREADDAAREDEDSEDERECTSIVELEDFCDYGEEKDERNESIEDFWARITSAPS